MNPRTVGPDGEDGLALSVVIITENEEDRIADCIESVVTAAENAVSAFEIVLVDSASTDRTVEAASEYPITVLQIPEGDTVSCGAGRYVGDQVARGELVLHVDGDMCLTNGWLAAAVHALRTDPEVAAVEGWLNESEDDSVREVQKVGGVMCYDAGALAKVGGFDPFLHGYEDVDAGYRLTAAGYRLLRLPSVSAEHPTSGGSLTEPIRRWQSGFLFAPGQAIRNSLDRPAVLRMLLGRQRHEGALLGWLGLGLASTRSRRLSVGWIVGSLLGAGALVQRLGAREATQFTLAKFLRLIGLLYGLSLSTRSAYEYPLQRVRVVQGGELIAGNPAGEETGVTDADVSEADPTGSA